MWRRVLVGGLVGLVAQVERDQVEEHELRQLEHAAHRQDAARPLAVVRHRLRGQHDHVVGDLRGFALRLRRDQQDTGSGGARRS
ncbi:MAG: hypothetical protein U0521_18800 [Anaerolineae bacterium]